MEENFANNLIYLLKINSSHKEFLAQIRHWNNLKVAFEVETVWVKDFTKNQLKDILLISIPFTTIYYCKDNLLFPMGSLLPYKKIPGFLWTPIDRALQVELPMPNHNFFGINQQINIQLKQTEIEQEASIILVKMDLLSNYITTAAAIRLKQLKWVIINENQVLIIGTPLLPLNGSVFWQKNDFIFPLGFAFEFSILENYVAQKIDTTGSNFIFWLDANHYTIIPKKSFQPLSISSWRNTIEAKLINEF